MSVITLGKNANKNLTADLSRLPILRAEVKNYNARDDKRFGFLTLAGESKDIFFHFDRGSDPEFDGGETPVIRGRTPHRQPEVGDLVTFQKMVTEKGPCAIWWAFTEQYEEILTRIRQRPLFRLVYRKGRQSRSSLDNGEQLAFSYTWEGKDLRDLRKRFPKQKYPSGEFDTHGRFFQIFNPSDEAWLVVEDPR